jgi:hypothetical protein
MNRNNFESLSQNKNELLSILAFDDDLAKCLVNASPNFKDNVVTDDDKANLVYKNIFPYMKTTSTIKETGSFITMKFKYRRDSKGNKFKTASIIFFVFCDESIIKTNYGILRTDYLLTCLDRLLSDTRIQSGIGKLEFDSMEDSIVDSEGKYIGFSLLYKNIEFQ